MNLQGEATPTRGVVGSLAGGGDLGPVDLIYIPEPSTLALLSFGVLISLAGKRSGRV